MTIEERDALAIKIASKTLNTFVFDWTDQDHVELFSAAILKILVESHCKSATQVVAILNEIENTGYYCSSMNYFTRAIIKKVNDGDAEARVVLREMLHDEHKGCVNALCHTILSEDTLLQEVIDSVVTRNL